MGISTVLFRQGLASGSKTRGDQVLLNAARASTIKIAGSDVSAGKVDTSWDEGPSLPYTFVAEELAIDVLGTFFGSGSEHLDLDIVARAQLMIEFGDGREEFIGTLGPYLRTPVRRGQTASTTNTSTDLVHTWSYIDAKEATEKLPFVLTFKRGEPYRIYLVWGQAGTLTAAVDLMGRFVGEKR